MKIIVHDGPHGDRDITLAVQAIYDGLTHSMDAGSGFLDTEESDAIHRLAKVCGFEDFEYCNDPCLTCSHARQVHYGKFSYATKIEEPIKCWHGILFKDNPQCPCTEFVQKPACVVTDD